MSTEILQISAAYKPAYIYGGPTMSVAKLCETLKNAGCEIEVLTTTANGKTELNVKSNQTQQIEGVPVTYFKRLTKDHTHFSPALLIGLRKKLRKNKQTIVHIHAWWNLVSILSCQVAKWRKIPVVLSPRGMLTAYTLGNRNSYFKSIIHRLMGKSLLKYCHIHATSKMEEEDVLQVVKPKSITVIHNLVELHKPAHLKPPHHDHDIFKLIFLSRIEEKKGLELLFRALAKSDVNWFLTIGGSGEELYVNQLKSLAKELEINSQIEWIGQVSPADKFDVLVKHDLTVLTSHNENFANVVIESLSVGTPVLVSEQVGLKDYVKTNELGWVAKLDVEEIEKKIKKAFQEAEKREHIRKNAPLLIQKDFDSINLVQQYIALYQSVY